LMASAARRTSSIEMGSTIPESLEKAGEVWPRSPRKSIVQCGMAKTRFRQAQAVPKYASRQLWQQSCDQAPPDAAPAAPRPRSLVGNFRAPIGKRLRKTIGPR